MGTVRPMSTPTDSQGTPAPILGGAIKIAGASVHIQMAPAPDGSPCTLLVVGNPVAAAAIPLDDEAVGAVIAALTTTRQECRVRSAASDLAADRPGLVLPNGAGEPRKLHRL